MAALILLAMIGVPIVEIAVFIRAGEAIGVGPTLALVVLTAIVGTVLLRHQGLSTLARFQASLEAGRPPVAELFHGLCLLVAGALLLTPGFVTDGFGLALFLPPFRRFLLGLLTRRLAARGGFAAAMPGGPGAARDPRVIDGEFEELDPEKEEPKDGPDGGVGPP